MNTKKAKTQESQTLRKILNEIPKQEYEKIKKKMLLATRIDEARIKAGLKKLELAKALNKRPSEISKWLSGTHNFTVDTLWDIEKALSVKLVNLNKEKAVETIVKYKTIYVQQTSSPSPCHFIFSLGGLEDSLSSILKANYNLYGERK